MEQVKVVVEVNYNGYGGDILSSFKLKTNVTVARSIDTRRVMGHKNKS